MPQPTIRPLTEADAREYQDLRLRGLRDHPEALGSTYEEEKAYSMEFVAGRLRRTAQSNDDVTLGAHIEGKLTGILGFTRMTGELERHRGYIGGVYVVPEEQGKGIGRALLSNAIDFARSLDGLEQIDLLVESRHEAAKSLYGSLGFVSNGIDPTARLLDGQYIYEERMVLFL